MFGSVLLSQASTFKIILRFSLSILLEWILKNIIDQKSYKYFLLLVMFVLAQQHE